MVNGSVALIFLSLFFPFRLFCYCAISNNSKLFKSARKLKTQRVVLKEINYWFQRKISSNLIFDYEVVFTHLFFHHFYVSVKFWNWRCLMVFLFILCEFCTCFCAHLDSTAYFSSYVFVHSMM